jgi:hypothetical protein
MSKENPKDSPYHPKYPRISLDMFVIKVTSGTRMLSNLESFQSP